MKREDFPEWTPAILGWEYPFTDFLVGADGTVTSAQTSTKYPVRAGYYVGYTHNPWDVRMYLGSGHSLHGRGNTLQAAIARFEKQLRTIKREVAKL